eukprot:8875438-Pyramimonas_sp.AAC.1
MAVGAGRVPGRHAGGGGRGRRHLQHPHPGALSCNWFSRWVYTASSPSIGSHTGYILPPLLRLVLTLGIYCPQDD